MLTPEHKHINGYQVILGQTTDDLSQRVLVDLKDGWELYGYPFECRGEFCQAMTRTTELDES